MKQTDKTLLEQMKINEIEIDRRKELLDFTLDDSENLKACNSIIQKEIDNIVSSFYDQQTEVEEISLIIGDSDTLERLREAQREYILALFAGFYDMEYVNNRLRIGLVHKRIGVEPKLYLSAMRALKQILNRTLRNNISDKNKLADTLASLEKLLFFDIEFVFDTYVRSLLAEIESSRHKAELYALSLEDKVAQRTRELRELSLKDTLTNLYNRRALSEFMRRDIANAKRQKLPISFVYFDVDKFKQINDQEGHLQGDAILKDIGQVLNNCSREGDIPCRYGGDEFCVLLPGSTADAAKSYCDKVIKEFSKLQSKVTFSMGLSQTGPEKFISAENLIKQADNCMYEAKKTEGHYLKCHVND